MPFSSCSSLPSSPAEPPRELDVDLGLGSASLPHLALHQGHLRRTSCFIDEAKLETLVSWNKKRPWIWVRAGTVFTVGPGKEAQRESGLQAWQTDRNMRPGPQVKTDQLRLYSPGLGSSGWLDL